MRIRSSWPLVGAPRLRGSAWRASVLLAALPASAAAGCAHRMSAAAGQERSVPPGPKALASRLPARLPPSHGRVFYVPPPASSAAAGSRRRPWRTIQKALDSLRPGQTALVRAGVYVESLVFDRAGARGRTITVRNYPGDRPIVRERGNTPLDYPL